VLPRSGTTRLAKLRPARDLRDPRALRRGDVMSSTSGRIAQAAASKAAEAASKAAEAAPKGAMRPAPRVTLRKAAMADADMIWEWSFATDLRLVMQAPRVVLFKDYARWLAGRIADRLTAMWIIEDAGASVGVALIDRNDRQALPRLTVVIGRRFRRRGLGRRALEVTCEQWQRPLIAEVDSTNVAGVRSLEAAGFERTNERQLGSVLRCTYLWSP